MNIQRIRGTQGAVKLVLSIFILFITLSVADAEPVKFVDHSWESIQVHNRIAGFILQHGFEKEVSYTFAETMPGLLGLAKGDVDVIMEGWTDNFHEWWQDAVKKDLVYDAGNIFPDAPQGWYVPAYVINGDDSRGIDAVAPDLSNVSDLKKYWELFEDQSKPGKGRLYNGPSGWMVHTINLKKIKAYGLDDLLHSFDAGSQTALAAAIAGAYEKGEPVLAYYWEPTAIMGKYDMVKLEEPPYDAEAWDKNFGCAHPPADVVIILNAEFAKENPEIKDFFNRYESTLSQTNKALAYMSDNDTTPRETAVWFLKGSLDTWSKWVNDPEKISRIKEALNAR